MFGRLRSGADCQLAAACSTTRRALGLEEAKEQGAQPALLLDQPGKEAVVVVPAARTQLGGDAGGGTRQGQDLAAVAATQRVHVRVCSLQCTWPCVGGMGGTKYTTCRQSGRGCVVSIVPPRLALSVGGVGGRRKFRTG